MIKYIKSKIQLLLEILKTLKQSDYLEWKSKDKSYLELCIEWLFDYPFKYLFIGILITLAITTPGIIGLILKTSVGYWLLSKSWLIK